MTGLGAGETYFSVIVPTLNEEPWVASAIRTARTALGPDAEIIVADGGSRDRTVEIARESAQV